MNNTTIYILLLEEHKYYIGKTRDIITRYQEHLHGLGSAWTRKYKPISLERTIENSSIFEEDRYVKEYMYMHGIDNVRGGSYSTIELTNIQKEGIMKEIWGATDSCNRCGQQGHFVKDCKENIMMDETSMQQNWFPKLIVNFFSTMFVPSNYRRNEYPPINNTCYRCGRSGHFINQCYARMHINGRFL